jgi:hypothetical protein
MKEIRWAGHIRVARVVEKIYAYAYNLFVGKRERRSDLKDLVGMGGRIMLKCILIK